MSSPIADALPLKATRAIEAAQGYLLLELPDAALRELRYFGVEDDVPPAAILLRAEAYRAKEDWEASLKCFEKALPESERPLDTLMGMAWCFKRIGRLDKAIESMRQAYHSSPKEPIVLYNLSCYYSLAGEKEEALSWLGRALRMDSSLRKLIPKESDFDSIRNDPDFRYLLELAEPKTMT